VILCCKKFISLPQYASYTMLVTNNIGIPVARGPWHEEVVNTLDLPPRSHGLDPQQFHTSARYSMFSVHTLVSRHQASQWK